MRISRTQIRQNVSLIAIAVLCLVLPGCPAGSAGFPSLQSGSLPTTTATNSAGGTGMTGSGGTTAGGGSGTGTGTGDGGTIPTDPNGGGGDTGVIQTYKPALAVRATGCVMCHANVTSPVITDFGFGDAYYFGAGVSGLSPLYGSIYGDHAQNWNTAQVYGSIIVPKAGVSGVSGVSASSLQAYLSSVITAPDANTPAPTVTEKNAVYIGAPTALQVLDLAGTFPAQHPLWKFIPSPSTVSDVSGLSAMANNNYVENSGELDCDGDLIVDSVLFLNNLQLRTGQGCRIYTTHSVFIQGPITYVGNSSTPNLQISSSRAIILGLGNGPLTINASDPTYTTNSLVYRLQQFWTRGGYATREAADTQSKLDTIVNESLLIGSDLIDAQLQTNGRQVAYSHVLLNAPNIQSRYQGEFDGVIIAEVFISSLTQFHFAYDNVFSQVPVLPLLAEDDYLTITP